MARLRATTPATAMIQVLFALNFISSMLNCLHFLITVGKRFIRSISTLKKNQTATVEDEDGASQPTRQKIDQERVLLQSPKDSSAAAAAAANSNVHKGSMRLFFTGGLNRKVNKNAISSTTSHIKDIFEINNEVSFYLEVDER